MDASSLMVVATNITNSTSFVLSTNDIEGYTNCNTYRWGVSASAGTVYGFTNIFMASDNFTFTSGSIVFHYSLLTVF